MSAIWLFVSRQLSLLPSVRWEMRNEHCPKCGDTMRLEGKGKMAYSIRGWQIMCDNLVSTCHT